MLGIIFITGCSSLSEYDDEIDTVYEELVESSGVHSFVETVG